MPLFKYVATFTFPFHETEIRKFHYVMETNGVVEKWGLWKLFCFIVWEASM